MPAGSVAWGMGRGKDYFNKITFKPPVAQRVGGIYTGGGGKVTQVKNHRLAREGIYAHMQMPCVEKLRRRRATLKFGRLVTSGPFLGDAAASHIYGRVYFVPVNRNSV